MMKNIGQLSLLLLSTLVFTGCEEIVENPQLEYKEKIVVRGLLKAGDLLDQISLSHTLPPLEPVPRDIATLQEKIAIKEATASITVDGKNSYKLVGYYDTLTVSNMKYLYQYYRTESPVVVKAGSTYEIRVEWNGKKAYAKTFVPLPVTADSISIGEAIDVYTSYSSSDGGPWVERTDTSRYNYVNSIFMPRRGEAYGAIIRLDDRENETTDYYDEQFNEVLTSADAEDDGNLRLVSNQAYRYQNGSQPDSIRLNLYAYDGAYYSYYKSYDHNDLGEGAFFTGSNQRVRWNVQGDAIGLFVAFSVTNKSYPFK